jgi:hypothetical protein
VDEDLLKRLPGAKVVLIGIGNLCPGREGVNASAV